MARLRYTEISKRRFKPSRNVVISKATGKDGVMGYSIAEQLVAEEQGNETKVFMRGGLGIVDRAGLFALKEAVDEACNQITGECTCDVCSCDSER